MSRQVGASGERCLHEHQFRFGVDEHELSAQAPQREHQLLVETFRDEPVRGKYQVGDDSGQKTRCSGVTVPARKLRD